MKLARETATHRIAGERPERQAPRRPPAPTRAARTAATVAFSAAALGTAVKLLRCKNR